MTSEAFIVFTYGSNMLSARIRERCASARLLGVGELAGYELRWHKRSRKDGSGKCDIVVTTAPNAIVWGALFEIARDEKTLLDRFEGLGAGYEEKQLKIVCRGKSMGVLAYVATDIDSTLKPFTWYRAFVVAGAEENHLPRPYIERIKSANATEDPDRDRHAQKMRLIEGA